MNVSENPYCPPKNEDVGRTKPVATWRLVAGSVFRVLGLVLIAIPLVAIVGEFFRSRLKDPSLDFWGIMIAVVVYLALGCWFVNLANLFSPAGDGIRDEVDQRRDF